MKLTAPIQKLADEIKSTYAELLTQEATAVNTALYLGALLNEAKELVGHGEFIAYRRKTLPALSDDRAERYMRASQNVVRQVDLSGSPVAVSMLLSAPADDLPDDAAREAQQLLFDFTRDKTIRDCLAAVVIDGDEAHRITRAANGKKHGGTKGEDRKNWPQFIGEKLSDITAHLKHWKSYTGPQLEDIGTKIKSFVGRVPTPFLTMLKDAINQELKTR